MSIFNFLRDHIRRAHIGAEAAIFRQHSGLAGARSRAYSLLILRFPTKAEFWRSELRAKGADFASPFAARLTSRSANIGCAPRRRVTDPPTVTRIPHGRSFSSAA